LPSASRTNKQDQINQQNQAEPSKAKEGFNLDRSILIEKEKEET
jgi:hypothetical protein